MVINLSQRLTSSFLDLSLWAYLVTRPHRGLDSGQVSLIGRHAWSMYLSLLGSRLCLSNLIGKVISNKSHFLMLNYTSGSIVAFGTSVAIH